MKQVFKTLVCWLCVFTFGATTSFAGTTNNQTDLLSPIYSESGLPFRVVIERANFTLPVGFHSGAIGVYQGYWIFIAGRMNGLHGFGGNPFPADLQNTTVYVVNATTGAASSRLLSDPSSGLTQQQIDSLSVTSPEWYQEGNTLYLVGGYGIDTASGAFTTKSTLTAINLPGILQWVTQPSNANNSVIKNISQISDPIFKVTGGKMFKLGNMTQLVFGQDFEGVYDPNANGNYIQQIRQFQISSNNGQVSFTNYTAQPASLNSDFRRRDLNVAPVLYNSNNLLKYGLVAYSGVFTPASGIWTVPVFINEAGTPSMADPNSSASFKQGMNNYVSATAGLYSRKYASMYNIFFGGLSYGYYQNGVFQTDSGIGFTNQVTTVQMDKNGNFTQYFMSGQYPVIPSTGPNLGNTLLFGASAHFIASNISAYQNGVINLDNIRQATVIGYIVGGIQSTLQDTNNRSDSAASPYVFKVTLVPV